LERLKNNGKTILLLIIMRANGKRKTEKGKRKTEKGKL
jgi:hypothetical protein